MLMHTRRKVVGMAYGSADPVRASTVAQKEVGTYAITIAPQGARCSLRLRRRRMCECEIRNLPLRNFASSSRELRT